MLPWKVIASATAITAWAVIAPVIPAAVHRALMSIANLQSQWTEGDSIGDINMCSKSEDSWFASNFMDRCWWKGWSLVSLWEMSSWIWTGYARLGRDHRSLLLKGGLVAWFATEPPGSSNLPNWDSSTLLQRQQLHFFKLRRLRKDFFHFKRTPRRPPRWPHLLLDGPIAGLAAWTLVTSSRSQKQIDIGNQQIYIRIDKETKYIRLY